MVFMRLVLLFQTEKLSRWCMYRFKTLEKLMINFSYTIICYLSLLFWCCLLVNYLSLVIISMELQWLIYCLFLMQVLSKHIIFLTWRFIVSEISSICVPKCVKYFGSYIHIFFFILRYFHCYPVNWS